jgi:hypothetical protein
MLSSTTQPGSVIEPAPPPGTPTKANMMNRQVRASRKCIVEPATATEMRRQNGLAM